MRMIAMSIIAALLAVLVSVMWAWYPSIFFFLPVVVKSYDIVAELSPHLSLEAKIVQRDSDQFDRYSTRWQTYRSPKIDVFVDVTTERDIQETIKFANKYDIQFLAISGGHGAISSLDRINHGLGIWMRRLNQVKIQPDGKTALIGGGTLSKEVVDALWAKGKQTVTGGCECTGVVAPMLGGGHGWLQGRYGLSADNLVEARMVLANGTAVTVSKDSHPDLFWAIRGAGHNFGIVTEFIYKIYDVPEGNSWTIETLMFKGDQVEKLYEKENELGRNGTQPVEIMTFQYFAWVPPIDPLNPVIIFMLVFEGSKEDVKPYSAPFHALGPASATIHQVSFPDIAGLTGLSNADPACQHGLYSSIRFPTSLKEYKPAAQRKVFDLFKQVTTKYPALNGSLFLWERYSVQGVQSVSSESTAFPDRASNLLISPLFLYEANKALDSVTIKVGREMRDILREASGYHDHIAYVNYAHGDESQGELYGHEEWSLERLRALKRLYDPHGKFSFYAPIR